VKNKNLVDAVQKAYTVLDGMKKNILKQSFDEQTTTFYESSIKQALSLQ
jgi:hypothetical protein